MLLNSNGNFTGKVAFVTGAANGIGRATVLAFAREGANVVVADVSEQGNHETAHMIEELGGRAISVKCNVTQAEDVKAALDKTIETFGRLDFAFNNAGVEQKIAATAELDDAEWDRIVNINLRGVLVPEARNPADAQARRWHDREYLFRCWGQRLQRSSGLCVRKAWRDWTDQVGGARLRLTEHPHQCRVSRNY
nr:SDR family NAD(P)-dependent oxidoreductase [Gloeocapsopsis sp. IPPAS B-1203]